MVCCETLFSLSIVHWLSVLFFGISLGAKPLFLEHMKLADVKWLANVGLSLPDAIQSAMDLVTCMFAQLSRNEAALTHDPAPSRNRLLESLQSAHRWYESKSCC